MIVITRIYDEYDAARNARDAVDALRLPNVQVSILGNEDMRHHHDADMRNDSMTDRSTTMEGDPNATATATGAGLGAAIGGGAGLLAGLGMLAIPGVGPLVAAGWLAATAVGAAGGAVAGGTVGAIVDLGLTAEETPVFSEAIRRGSVAVSVQSPEESRLAVEAALDRVSTISLSERRARYEAEGWRHDASLTDPYRRTPQETDVNPVNRIL